MTVLFTWAFQSSLLSIVTPRSLADCTNWRGWAPTVTAAACTWSDGGVDVHDYGFGVIDGDNYITMFIVISNRTVNDEVNEDEFEYQFNKLSFLDDLHETIYNKYKIELFGVDFKYLDIEYEHL
mgnify:CR=1 FL=1